MPALAIAVRAKALFSSPSAFRADLDFEGQQGHRLALCQLPAAACVCCGCCIRRALPQAGRATETGLQAFALLLLPSRGNTKLPTWVTFFGGSYGGR